MGYADAHAPIMDETCTELARGCVSMGHRRCVEGYDRAFKGYNEKQRATVLGS